MSAYNEEKVIEAKLKSFANLDYPSDKISFWIGSDGSSDRTDDMVNDFKHPSVKLFRYEDRAGKANVLNRLRQELEKEESFDVTKDIFILTDANVLFTTELVREIVKPFSDEKVGQVGAVISNYGEDPKGISVQEKFYIGSENRLKIYEGRLWGAMMGAFGACYALRASLFPELKKTFLMEDFYISMGVLKKGYKAVMAEKAICKEDLPSEVGEEYKRKTRISAGNFQNLSVYKSLLLGFDAVAYCFLSHKVLRWLGPLWIGLIGLGLILMTIANQAWIAFLIGYLIFLLFPLIDRLAKAVGIHSVILRYPAYFIEMNLALLNGFFMYQKGVRTNAWQPTKRNN